MRHVRARKWTSGEVVFVDEIDAGSGLQTGDIPVWILGGALPLAKRSGDPELERDQLADVEFFG
jgi:hypothetical protein